MIYDKQSFVFENLSKNDEKQFEDSESYYNIQKIIE